jgi:hypothetical protein
MPTTTITLTPNNTSFIYILHSLQGVINHLEALIAKIIIDQDTYINDLLSWLISNSVWILAMLLLIRLILSIRFNNNNNTYKNIPAIPKVQPYSVTVIPKQNNLPHKQLTLSSPNTAIISLKNQRKTKVNIVNLDNIAKPKPN